MQNLELRKRFVGDALLKGWVGLDDIPNDYMPEVDRDLLQRWFNQMEKANELKLPEIPRLVNRFTLGADPEFVMSDPMTLRLVPGAALGFRTGLAFGVDSNGRLIEVRPQPSRWAMEVLASVLATLRWLGRVHPETLAYSWEAGAFKFRDGLGGHIHLGRKSSKLFHKEQTLAMDRLCDIFAHTGMFPKDEMLARRGGDQFNQRYGQYGDVRPQKYGYEYRTFPSWLDSPVAAYLTLVASKLVAHDPGVFKQLKPGVGLSAVKNETYRLRRLFAKWQALDDDAALALHTLNNYGIPAHVGGDFKARWGVAPGQGLIAPQKGLILPSVIPPSKFDIEKLYCHLAKHKPLEFTIPEVTWPHSSLEKGYFQIVDETITDRVPGLGELLVGWIGYEKVPVKFAGLQAGARQSFRVGMGLAEKLGNAWQHKLRKAFPKVPFEIENRISQTDKVIYVCQELRNNRPLARKIFVESEVFPIWKIEDVKKDSYDKWLSGLQTKQTKVATKVLLELGK